MGPDEMHPRVLMELADVVIQTTLYGIWKKVAVTVKKDNITPIFKKGKKKWPMNYGPISLITLQGKVMEPILLIWSVRNASEDVCEDFIRIKSIIKNK